MKQAVEQIRSALVPSAIIGRKIPLKLKSVGEFLGLCPFHNEKTPSFTVSDIKGFYHCFGCGEHGDIFSFVMKNENYTYKETLEFLAREAGISLPKYTPKQIDEERRLQSLYSIFESVAQYYQSKLHSPEGGVALEYLKSRGLKQETIDVFRLGFAPVNQAELISYLERHNKRDLISSSGVLGKPNTEKLYNMFRGRVIFPIVNKSGRVIAFGGRSIDGAEPKYLNSAENPIFIKGLELFNLNIAAPAAAKEGGMLVVEGYMDVISLANQGIKAVVAPLGTAAKVEQIKQLWNYVSEPIICFDSDNAGKNAAKRLSALITPHLKPGKSLKFLRIEGEKDPDDLIRKHGKVHFLKLLKESMNLSDFIFENEAANVLSRAPEHLTNLKGQLNAIADQIDNSDLKKAYKAFFNDRFFNTFIKKSPANKKLKVNIDETAIISATLSEGSQYVRRILEILVSTPHLLADNSFRDALLHLEIHTKDLDNLRNKLLSISELGNSDLIISELEKLKKQEIGENDLKLTNDIFSSKFFALSDEEPRSFLERLFNLVELDIIKGKIVFLTDKLIENPSEEVFQKLRAIKELEEKLKLNLGVS